MKKLNNYKKCVIVIQLYIDVVRIKTAKIIYRTGIYISRLIWDDRE